MPGYSLAVFMDGGKNRRKTAGYRPVNIWTRTFPCSRPVLSPDTPLDCWIFSLEGEIDAPKRWTWDEFQALPRETITKDIHCVTHWSKLDTIRSVEERRERKTTVPPGRSRRAGSGSRRTATE